MKIKNFNYITLVPQAPPTRKRVPDQLRMANFEGTNEMARLFNVAQFSYFILPCYEWSIPVGATLQLKNAMLYDIALIDFATNSPVTVLP